MDSEIAEAPFTDEEVRILKLWQENGFMHPYTCCEGDPMEVTNEGLICKTCGRKQEWVHSFSLKESAATYIPFKFKKEIDDEE